MSPRGPLLLLMGCGPSDAQLHMRALLEDPDLATASASCAQIEAPALRGQCVVNVMDRWDSTDPTLCAALPEGDVWRDECFFLSTRDVEASLEQRLARCDQAGRFRDFCGMHQWTHEIQMLAETGQQPAEMARQAEALLESQRARNAWDDHYTERVWTTLWSSYFEQRPLLDPALCETLDQNHRTPCHQALAANVHALLWRLAEQEPKRAQALCANLPQSLSGLRFQRSGPRLPEDPTLLAASAAYLAPFCAGKPLGPEPGKLPMGAP